MILPSYFFIFIFLPVVVALYYFANHKGRFDLGKLVLLAASAVFYFSLGYKGFLCCLASITVCYLIANFGLAGDYKTGFRKSFLAIGIILNVLLLAYCKYLVYFEILLNKYTGSAFTYTAFVVPVGISYFTFSQIAFLVDSYRNPDCMVSFLDYSLFVTFFPKVTVGPIAFASDLIPQFNDESLKKVDFLNLNKGFFRFTVGMAKKLLIADNLAPIVDYGYLNVASLGSVNALITVVSYTLQIYFDFSGYCDIAIGICQMLNLELIENFDSPYRALSIAEFWKRWHISLTRFFRNYLYIPLGGNRKGKIRTYINTMIIFLVSGLWHGAATTFIVWGAIHGVGSIVSKIISPVMKKVPSIIRWFITFSFVSLAWIFFRSPDLSTALLMLKQLFAGGLKPIDINMVATCIPVEGQLIQWLVLKAAPSMTYYSGSIIVMLLICVGMLACTLLKSASERVQSFKASGRTMIFTVVLFIWSVLSLSQVTEFIYVNF